MNTATISHIIKRLRLAILRSFPRHVDKCCMGTLFRATKLRNRRTRRVRDDGAVLTCCLFPATTTNLILLMCRLWGLWGLWGPCHHRNRVLSAPTAATITSSSSLLLAALSIFSILSLSRPRQLSNPDPLRRHFLRLRKDSSPLSSITIRVLGV